MTPQNITSGFRKSGIYPFDKHIFTDDDFVISKVTDRNQTEDEAGPSNINAEMHVTAEVSNSENTAETQETVETMETDVIYDTNKTENTDDSNKIEGNDKTKKSDKKGFISPEILKGYPKATELKRKNRARKKKSIIATDTPELNAIEEKAREKQRKKDLQTSKKQGKTVKTILFDSSSDENDSYEEMQGGTSDEVSDDENTVDANFHFPELDKEPSINDYVLVEFKKKANIIYYVGKILQQKNYKNEFEVNFLRRSTKSRNSFVFPVEEDIGLVLESDIKLILSKYLVLGQTKRQQSLIKFEINLSMYDVR